MRNSKQSLFPLILVIAMSGPRSAAARCDPTPDLSAIVTEFESIQKSRVEALLRFGESQSLCFALEHVDTKLLAEPADFHIRKVPIGETIISILGQERSLTIQLDNGIIDIGQGTFGAGTKNIFDYVLPRFEARRASVQEISIALHMQFVADVNPQITGFAGHYSAGDLEDQVGPLSEYNRSLRYLLNTVVLQSKGGAWIARVPLKLRGELATAERHRVWTIVQYGVPSTGYASILREIATDLESDSHFDQKPSH